MVSNGNIMILSALLLLTTSLHRLKECMNYLRSAIYMGVKILNVGWRSPLKKKTGRGWCFLYADNESEVRMTYLNSSLGLM